jgi:hypothetical protein
VLGFEHQGAITKEGASVAAGVAFIKSSLGAVRLRSVSDWLKPAVDLLLEALAFENQQRVTSRATAKGSALRFKDP